MVAKVTKIEVKSGQEQAHGEILGLVGPLSAGPPQIARYRPIDG
jgi:hypothetical protein